MLKHQLHDIAMHPLYGGVEENRRACAPTRGVDLTYTITRARAPDTVKQEAIVDPVLPQLIEQPVESLGVG